MIDNLTEAISHAKEVAKANRDKAESYNCGEDYEQIKANECVVCAKEHEQLADWLTELKQRREHDKKGECQECEFKKFSERMVDVIVDVMNKYGITSVEELEQRVRGGAE